MMIKSSLHLIFALLYKYAYLSSDSEKRKKIGSVFDYFTVILVLWNINSFQRLNPAFNLWLDYNSPPSSTAKLATCIYDQVFISSLNKGKYLIFSLKKVGAKGT